MLHRHQSATRIAAKHRQTQSLSHTLATLSLPQSHTRAELTSCVATNQPHASPQNIVRLHLSRTLSRSQKFTHALNLQAASPPISHTHRRKTSLDSISLAHSLAPRNSHTRCTYMLHRHQPATRIAAKHRHTQSLSHTLATLSLPQSHTRAALTRCVDTNQPHASPQNIVRHNLSHTL
jgi:hypothetical protein